jgi:hypothetical protein
MERGGCGGQDGMLMTSGSTVRICHSLRPHAPRAAVTRHHTTPSPVFLWLLLLVPDGRHVEPEASSSEPMRTKARRRRAAMEEEDVRRCRAPTEEVVIAGHLPHPCGQDDRTLLRVPGK